MVLLEYLFQLINLGVVNLDDASTDIFFFLGISLSLLGREWMNACGWYLSGQYDHLKLFSFNNRLHNRSSESAGTSRYGHDTCHGVISEDERMSDRRMLS